MTVCFSTPWEFFVLSPEVLQVLAFERKTLSSLCISKGEPSCALSPVSPLTSALIYLASKMDHFIQSEGQRGQEMYPGCACRTAQEGSGGLPPNLVSRAPSHPLHTACNPTLPTLLLLPGFNWLAGLRPGISRAPENVFILMYFYISSKKEYNQNDYILMSPV